MNCTSIVISTRPGKVIGPRYPDQMLEDDPGLILYARKDLDVSFITFKAVTINGSMMFSIEQSIISGRC